jgi:hypothetical protein
MNGLEEVLSEMLTDLKWFVAFMAVAMALSGTRSMLAQGGRIDDDRAAAAGIRKLTSQHLTLYTDVPQGQDVDEFPGVFDLAVPQWCRYFDLDPARARDWRMTGFVMRDRARFQDAGLLPADLPKFPNGYQRGANFWLYDQKDAYYRRHLFLHEGTHAFMDRVAGGSGSSRIRSPPARICRRTRFWPMAPRRTCGMSLMAGAGRWPSSWTSILAINNASAACGNWCAAAS